MNTQEFNTYATLNLSEDELVMILASLEITRDKFSNTVDFDRYDTLLYKIKNRNK